ncbi:hypothetical protein [Caulobacter sp.]|uniref:hypothetical protein n=1 Tax=Caulobacter sp. TaxID=78 RepID=UPI002B46B086|nr:hypothetical protein [Caulobacter sp.]HJV42002.1 hypothetical protein [Caulobacter sp.]
MVNSVNLIALLLLPLTVLVSGFAIWKGRAAERMSGIALLGTLIFQIALMSVFRALGVTARVSAPMLDVAISLILGLVFLWAALKHNSRWLGFAFIVQGAELTISAYFLGPDVPLTASVYFRLLNVMTLLTVSLLAVATVHAILLRRRESTQAD